MSTSNSLFEQKVKADFFSVFLEEQMSSSLRSCLEFCVDTFASKYYDTHLSYSKRAAITGILDSVINLGFLIKYDALFSEFFYKLSRVNLARSGLSSKLPKKRKIIIILCYLLKNHFIEKVQSWLSKQNQSQARQANSNEKFSSKLLRRLGVFLVMASKLAQFIFKIR